MAYWIQPAQIFDGKQLISGGCLHIANGIVTDIEPAVPAGVTPVQLAGIATPGFIDLQVNGGGDVLLNATPTRAGMQTIAAAHRRFGTVGIMPTVITDRPEVLDAAAAAVIAAKGDTGILGLHIEGPHISLPRRGTHAAEFVRPMDARTLAVVQALRRNDVPVMITLAPEAASPKQIADLVKMGAVVSLGHTDATEAQMQTAMAAGARCATHLFNAMSPMGSREPGAVGAIINSDLFAGIICDGIHVADSMVGLAIRARPVADRMFLVSDSMATVGGGDHFDLYGHRITLKDGRLVNAEGSLAGAHVTQAEGVCRLAGLTGVTAETALRMATSTPAACMRLPAYGQLLGRAVEDIILLDKQLRYQSALAELALS